MKNLIFILLAALIFSSCITRKACSRKFPPETKTVIEVREKVVLRDTLIFVRIPGEVVHSPGDTVFIDRITGLFNSRKNTLNTSLAFSTAQVVNGILQHSITQKDTTLQRLIQDAIKEHSTHTIEIKETIKEVNRLKWWQVALMWIGIASLILIAIRLIK